MSQHPLEKPGQTSSVPPGQPNLMSLQNSRAMLMGTIQRSANWFYIIAVLSIVNSALYLSNVQFSFIVGLAYTQFVDGFAKAFVERAHVSPSLGYGGALLLDVCIAGVFGLFGYFSRKGMRWAFIAGLVLYVIDGVIMLAVQDFISAAFHGFAIFNLYNGVRALGLVEKLDSQIKTQMPY